MVRKSKLTALELANAIQSNMSGSDKLNKNMDQAGTDLMQVDENSQPADSTQPTSKCGGALRLAREQNGFTIQDIASRLKISPKQIAAIEADHFDALPEPTIVRGFIRNYAKLLKIDAEPLLEAYKVIVPDKSPHAFAIKPASTMKVSGYEKPKMGRYIWGGFALLVGLAAWLFYQHYVQKPSPSTPTAPVETIEELPQPALPAAERLELNLDPSKPVSVNSGTPNSTSELNLNVSPNNVLPSSANEINVNDLATAEISNISLAQTATNALPSSKLQLSSTVNQIVQPSLNNAVNAEPLNIKPVNTELASEQTRITAGKSIIEFNTNQETWVSIKDVNGRKIFNKTMIANSRETLEFAQPISIIVGNAAGLSMNVNHKPVDLGPHTRGNIARLKID